MKDIETPLYFPKKLPLESLWYCINELCFDYDDHYYEIDETKVAPDDIVVDSGAAEGLFSLLIMKRCEQVYTIEPLPDYIEALKLTFANASNVVIMPYALGEEKGKGLLSENSVGSSLINKGKGVSVDITTIDDLFFNKGVRISYIKSDTEGSDLAILKGAEKTIKKYKPKIAITVYHKPDECKQIFEYLKSINPGYKIKIKGMDYKTQRNVMLHAWM
jgi:FkbM family methyltransferase